MHGNLTNGQWKGIEKNNIEYALQKIKFEIVRAARFVWIKLCHDRKPCWDITWMQFLCTKLKSVSTVSFWESSRSKYDHIKIRNVSESKRKPIDNWSDITWMHAGLVHNGRKHSSNNWWDDTLNNLTVVKRSEKWVSNAMYVLFSFISTKSMKYLCFLDSGTSQLA